MRYYSIVDNFDESGAALVPLDTHTPDNDLDAVWAQWGADPILEILPKQSAVIFTSTLASIKTLFTAHGADGFNEQFRMRFTPSFSNDVLSAGQYQKFILVDGSDDGYIVEVSTDGGDNTILNYKLSQYTSGVVTPIVGLDGVDVTPTSRFNIWVSLQDGQLGIGFNSQTVLTVAAPAVYDFTEFRFQGIDPADTGNCYLKRSVLLGNQCDPIFAKQYTDLLIKQYHEKPLAFAEIDMQSQIWAKHYSLMNEIPEEFDVDFAFGAQLDIVSKWVFGFIARDVAGTGETLTDEELRACIKIKIGKNWASSYMVSDDAISIQDVIQQIFNGGAYVVDNYDMALTLYIDETIDQNLIQKAVELDLLPHGQAVRYRALVQYNLDETFGFSNNPNALTWDNKNAVVTSPGKFARKVIF